MHFAMLSSKPQYQYCHKYLLPYKYTSDKNRAGFDSVTFLHCSFWSAFHVLLACQRTKVIINVITVATFTNGGGEHVIYMRHIFIHMILLDIFFQRWGIQIKVTSYVIKVALICVFPFLPMSSTRLSMHSLSLMEWTNFRHLYKHPPLIDCHQSHLC